jgi:DMSO reductase anchor subunit
MNFAFLVPISLFVCITLAIKFIMDGRVRRQIAESHASAELVQAMLQLDALNQRLSALKWGIVLCCVGAALGLIDVLNVDGNSPGTFGILLGACGIGLLIYHALASREKSLK